MSLNNKTILVTGASRGIGQAIALTLAKTGATVIGTATTDAGAQKISEDFAKQKLDGKGLVLDLSHRESIEQLTAQFGKEVAAPDILINNAGVTRDNLLLRMSDEEWQAVMDTNLTGMFQLSKICLKHMFKQRWGRMVNISSIVGLTGNAGQANYAASKAGLIGFSKSLAQEVASRGITVNVVAPGFIETDMTNSLPEMQRELLLKSIPSKRLGQGQDVAEAVLFLASEQANYITGMTIHVNGGMYMP